MMEEAGEKKINKGKPKKQKEGKKEDNRIGVLVFVYLSNR